MTMRRILFFIFLSFCILTSVSAQQITQLVSNPGFEDPVRHPPSTKRNTNKTGGLPLVDGWVQAGSGSVDYYNSEKSTANGFMQVHKARTGEGRIGMILGRYVGTTGENPNYREFVQTELKQPLEKGKIYSVNFYMVRDKRSNYYSGSVGAYFSDRHNGTDGTVLFGRYNIHTSNPKTMTNTAGWSLVHGYYRAEGGEKFLTIGCFGRDNLLDIKTNEYPVGGKPRIHTSDFSLFAYYYIDDVYVYEVSSPDSDNYKSILPKDVTQQAYNNFVLVLDVSTSMEKYNKIEALKKSVDSLLSTMNENETISIVTFDAQPKLLVKGMRADEKAGIIAAIDSLKTGGGTNVNAAVASAYELMDSTYIPNGNNKVILITDALFQLTKPTQNIIEKHAAEKKVDMLTVVLHDNRYNSIKKVKKNNGEYEEPKENTTYEALDMQVEERKLTDYGPGRKRSIKYLLKPALLIGVVAVLFIFRTK